MYLNTGCTLVKDKLSHQSVVIQNVFKTNTLKLSSSNNKSENNVTTPATKGKKNKNKKKREIHIKENTMSRARSVKEKEQCISKTNTILTIPTYEENTKLCFDFIRNHLPKSEANLDEKMQLYFNQLEEQDYKSNDEIYLLNLKMQIIPMNIDVLPLSQFNIETLYYSSLLKYSYILFKHNLAQIL